MKYKVGDIVYLAKRPHLGSKYPNLLQECADNETPVKIVNVMETAECCYSVKVYWQTYWIYSDEIADGVWIKCLFI